MGNQTTNGGEHPHIIHKFGLINNGLDVLWVDQIHLAAFNVTPPLLIVHSIVAFFVIQDLVTGLGSSIAAIIPPPKNKQNKTENECSFLLS